MLIKRSIKVFIILTVVFVLTAATYAFAAANTLPANTYAGDGATAISGITISGVQYTLSLTDSAATTYITGVSFTTVEDVTGSTIQIKLVASGGTWYDCTVASSTSVTCNTSSPAVTVAAANNLRVIVK